MRAEMNPPRTSNTDTVSKPYIYGKNLWRLTDVRTGFDLLWLVRKVRLAQKPLEAQEVEHISTTKYKKLQTAALK